MVSLFTCTPYHDLVKPLSTPKIHSGCGSVGGAVACDTRGPLFESNPRQKIIMNLTVEKTKIKKKEAENGPFFKKKDAHDFYTCFKYVNVRLGQVETMLSRKVKNRSI